MRATLSGMKLCQAGLHDLDEPGAQVKVKAWRKLADGSKREYTSTRCRECVNIKSRRANKTHALKLHDRFLEMYGRQCACPGCTEDRPVMLGLDHVNNDGFAHRLALGSKTSTMKVKREAVRDYRPDLYQPMCHNCNLTKGRHSCLD